MADSQLYSRLLLSKGAGYPLWLPEPYDDLPPAYTDGGVSIGDVGVITSDGAFDFVFNICVPSDHPVNSVGVPEDFEVAALSHGDIRRAPRHYPPGSDVSSAKLKKRSLAFSASSGDNPIIPAGGGAGFSISTSSREAAVLLLPDGGASMDLRRKQLFRDYALKHADRWYRFLNKDLGRMVENGSVYLITGVDKAASWGVACFSQDTSEGEVSLELKASMVATGNVKYSWTSTEVSPIAARAGPDEPGNLNQAVFLRGYKVMLRERFAGLRGAVKVSPVEDAKPRDLFPRKSYVPYSDVKSSSSRLEFTATGSSGPTEGDAVVEYFPEPIHVYHPADMINELILQDVQTASVAVTHDSDWISVLQDESIIPEGHELYRRLLEKYPLSTSEEGGVFFNSFDTSREISESPVSEIALKQVPEKNAAPLHAHNREPGVRLLLLGQSESGKSTLLRQFQRMYDHENFEKQRISRRPIIQSNIINSIRTIISAVAPKIISPRIDSGRSSPAEASVDSISVPGSIAISAPEGPGNSSSDIEALAATLLPLLDAEDGYERGPSVVQNLAGQLIPLPAVEMNAEQTYEVVRRSDASRVPFIGSKELETETQLRLQSMCGAVVRLWKNPDVQAILKTKKIHLEDNPGFFLDDLSRVTAADYVPSADDVIMSRVETTEPSQHTFEMQPNGHTPSSTWSIIDVGGSKTQRHKWLTFFENVNAIIFLAPLSGFDQCLAEDSTINRIEDSWTIWKEICSSILLAQVDLILFLNKYDVLERKLKAGIQLSKHIAGYQDRSNDVKTASAYLKNKFTAIHESHSSKRRSLHSFFTSVTDASSVSLVSTVRDMVVRQNLVTSDLL
ncbi:G-protein alpha subunit-domain-containing protein [Mycena metata]|uniref:G-protein alpha subunit-domain-containing protein n=1 Tax=Mycena metata TaxID=1033252 RepID=A0AAD7HMP6_9AGAR|nr:G-protein alpha subunit-domain-containing protein [Mycena metata]